METSSASQSIEVQEVPAIGEELVKDWIAQNPDFASRWLAQALDLAADSWGRSHEGRLARSVATQAHMLNIQILGLHEYFTLYSKPEDQPEQEKTDGAN